MQRTRGFTLIELLVVLALAAILATVTVPSFHHTLVRSRIASETNALVGDLQFARIEAIKRGQTVTVCASSYGTQCDTAAWEQGWIVFADPSGTGQVAPGVVPLRRQVGLSRGDTLTAQRLSGASLMFNRDGFATGLQAPGATFVVGDATGDPARRSCLSITLVGQISAAPFGVGRCA